MKKKRMVKAVLICPFDRIVREVQHDANDYLDIYAHLTHPEHVVDCFTIVHINDKGDVVFVDDNGLLNNPKKFFVWQGYEQPLAGRGLVLGTNDEGDTIATTLSAREVMERVMFLDSIRVAGFRHSEGEIDHPVFGKTALVKSEPLFKLKGDDE